MAAWNDGVRIRKVRNGRSEASARQILRHEEQQLQNSSTALLPHQAELRRGSTTRNSHRGHTTMHTNSHTHTHAPERASCARRTLQTHSSCAWPSPPWVCRWCRCRKGHSMGQACDQVVRYYVLPEESVKTTSRIEALGSALQCTTARPPPCSSPLQSQATAHHPACSNTRPCPPTPVPNPSPDAIRFPPAPPPSNLCA